MSTILAIETSCDETSVAIVKNRHILSNIVASRRGVTGRKHLKYPSKDFLWGKIQGNFRRNG